MRSVFDHRAGGLDSTATDFLFNTIDRYNTPSSQASGTLHSYVEQHFGSEGGRSTPGGGGSSNANGGSSIYGSSVGAAGGGSPSMAAMDYCGIPPIHQLPSRSFSRGHAFPTTAEEGGEEDEAWGTGKAALLSSSSTTRGGV